MGKNTAQVFVYYADKSFVGRKEISVMKLKDFQDYCWTFYGPNQLDGALFQNSLRREELDAACLLQSLQKTFEGDSFDREKVRDILLEVKELNK